MDQSVVVTDDNFSEKEVSQSRSSQTSEQNALQREYFNVTPIDGSEKLKAICAKSIFYHS
jgi:hypothetical protein